MDERAARKCVVDAIEASQEKSDSRQDLYAQQDMALWAFLMMLISGATVFVTGVGVYYVRETLTATRSAVQAAHDAVIETSRIGDAQIKASMDAVLTASEANRLAARQFEIGYKPWISVEIKGPFVRGGEDTGMFKDDEVYREIGLNANIFVHNIGEMPATIEDFSLHVLSGKEWPYVSQIPPGWRRSVDIFHVLNSKESVHIDKAGMVTVYHENDWPSELEAIRLTRENRLDFLQKPPPIVGYVVFSSPLGARYKHNFAFVAKHGAVARDFVRFGGTEYNREDPVDE